MRLAKSLQVFILVVLLLGSGAGQETSEKEYDPSQEPAKMSLDQLRAGIQKRHPGDYFILAARLFEKGEKDEAVFWFYQAQLRYRYFILGSDRAKVRDDVVYLDALFQTLGPQINAYAFGDLPKLRQTIDEVIQWDEETLNGFFDKATDPESRQSIIDGLRDLRQETIDREQEIRAEREKNGLENSSNS